MAAQSPTERLLESFPFADVVESAARTIAFLGLVVAVAAILEWRARADVTRYRSRAFLNDLVYALFYRGGFYAVLIFSVATAALDARLDFLRFGVLADAHLGVRLASFWILGDFILYWAHRWQHRSPTLWAFHAVHHSQENLTTLTQYRRHPLDQVFLGFWMYLVFPVALGLPPSTWLPLYVLTTTLQALQHAELNWRYGRLYPVVVSPVFHSFHHSADACEHNGNFGFMLSIWDHLFGTAVGGDRRPERYGVDGLDLPETLIDQLLGPFKRLWSNHQDATAAGRNVPGVVESHTESDGRVEPPQNQQTER